MKTLVRSLFARPPLRFVRDGFLRIGYALDPRLSALAAEMDWLREQTVAELDQWSWHRLDGVYARVRRSLRKQTLSGWPNWRKGPDYTCLVARQAYASLAAHAGFRDATYFDLGCGAHNPFGTSVAMFLNGAARTVAFDRANIDCQRAAEVLHEQLAHCALYPDDWHWSSSPREEFMRRLRLFNGRSLAEGNLDEGLRGLPLRYASGDVHAGLPVDDASVDIMSSRDVIEHFFDLPAALRAMRRAMKRNAVASHHVDLVDHLVYLQLDPVDFTPEARTARGVKEENYHAWSFLEEGETYRDPLCNRLRAPELRRAFQDAGFEILAEEAERHPLPDGFAARLAPRFAAMDQRDLEITRLTLVVRRA